MYANHLLIENFPRLQHNDTIAEMLLMIEKHSFLTEIPCLHNDYFLGTVKVKHLLLLKNNEDKTTTIDTLDLVHNKVSVYGDQHVFSILHDSYASSAQVIGVLNADNTHLGFLQIQDVYNYLATTYPIQNQGGVIVLKRRLIDYSLNGVAQIVEAENHHILASWTGEAEDFGYVYVSLKIDCLNLETLVSSFESHGYEVSSAFPYEKDQSKFDHILKFIDY